MKFTTEDDTLDFGEFDNMDPEEFKNSDDLNEDFGEDLLTDLDKELGIGETSTAAVTTTFEEAVTVNHEPKKEDKPNFPISSSITTATTNKEMDKGKQKEVVNDKDIKPPTQNTSSTTTTTTTITSKHVNNNITNNNNNNNRQSKATTATKSKSTTQYNNNNNTYNNNNNMQRYNQPNRNYMYNQHSAPFNSYNVLPNGLPYNQGFINGMPMNGIQAMAYNMSGNMNANMNTNLNAIPPRRIHINPKFAGARPPQLSNTNNQSLNNNNSNRNQTSNINQAPNLSVKRSSSEVFTNNNEPNDSGQKQRRTNNNNHAPSSTSKSLPSSPQGQQPSSSSSFQTRPSSSSTIEITHIKDSISNNKEIKLHRQQLLEQRHTFTTGSGRDIARITREAREKRREFLKTERETLERGEDYKMPIYNPLGVRRSGVKPIPFTKTSMFSIRGAALAAVESISPSTNKNNSNSNNSNSNNNRSNQYSITRNGGSLGVQHNNSSNNKITKNKVPIQQRLGNMNGNTNGNTNGNENGNNKNKNNHSASSPQRNNANGSPNPIPISTNGKSAKLKINYVADDVKDTNLRALEYGSGIKYVTFNRERGNAVAMFNSIDNAVNFRRKYNRSLLSGKHISINFCTDSD